MAGLSADPAPGLDQPHHDAHGGRDLLYDDQRYRAESAGHHGHFGLRRLYFRPGRRRYYDDAPALQRGFDTYAGTGAVFYLKSVHSNNHLLRGRVRQPSGITVICASPFLLKADGGWRHSRRAYAANRDAFRLGGAITAGATSITVDTSPYGGGNVRPSSRSVTCWRFRASSIALALRSSPSAKSCM